MGEGGELTPLNVKAVMVRAAVGMSPARTQGRLEVGSWEST